MLGLLVNNGRYGSADDAHAPAGRAWWRRLLHFLFGRN